MPPPEAAEVVSPKVNLIFSPADNAQRFLMPSFAGKPLAEAKASLEFLKGLGQAFTDEMDAIEGSG